MLRLPTGRPGRSRLAVLVASLTLLASVAGCGNQDDEESAQAISNSIMKGQKAAGGSQVLAVQRKDADCVGQHMVDSIGTDKLKEYGVLTEDNKADKGLGQVKMGAEDARKAASSFFDCTDVMSMVDKAVSGGQKLDAKTKQCLDGVLTEGAVRTLLQKSFEGKQDEATQGLVEPMMECMTGAGASPSG